MFKQKTEQVFLPGVMMLLSWPGLVLLHLTCHLLVVDVLVFDVWWYVRTGHPLLAQTAPVADVVAGLGLSSECQEH